MGSQSPEIVEPKQDKHLLDKVVVWLGLSVFFRHSTKIHTNIPPLEKKPCLTLTPKIKLLGAPDDCNIICNPASPSR